MHRHIDIDIWQGQRACPMANADNGKHSRCQKMEIMVSKRNLKIFQNGGTKQKSFQTISYQYTIKVIYTDVKSNSI